MACLRTFGVAAVATVAAAQDYFLATRQPEADASGVANATERALAGNGDWWQFVGEIRWAGQQNVCLDLAGGRQDNGNKLQAWECTGSDNQKFLYDTSKRSSQIKLAANTNKCLDVYDGSGDNFANVVLWDCHPEGHPDRAHQEFEVEGVGYSLQVRWQSKCLDLDNGVVGSPSQSHSRVITYDCHNFGDQDLSHQEWIFNDGSPRALCNSQLSYNACMSTPQCDWCGRVPASCYSTVEDPDACSN